jgi:8-oxo-dGTP diphosphatase
MTDILPTAARDLINGCYRIAYRLAYPLAKRWWRWRGLGGCTIAVWRNAQVLTVRNSYRPGLRLPGGGVKRGEDPRLAAIRELREETNVTVPLEVVTLVCQHTNRYGQRRTVFEVELGYDPELRVNQREIVAANFITPDEVMEYNALIRRYLRKRGDGLAAPTIRQGGRLPLRIASEK